MRQETKTKQVNYLQIHVYEHDSPANAHFQHHHKTQEIDCMPSQMPRPNSRRSQSPSMNHFRHNPILDHILLWYHELKSVMPQLKVGEYRDEAPICDRAIEYSPSVATVRSVEQTVPPRGTKLVFSKPSDATSISVATHTSVSSKVFIECAFNLVGVQRS